MGIIRELPKEVIEKIAAGEVVERPASIVKELIENSIDARAKSITVDIAEGGKKCIAVIDDGLGMDASDLARSVLRHATSKIAHEKDLFEISTMGFRGEALAAIGAVSRLTIESRLNDPQIIEGAKIEVVGGTASPPIAAGSAGGTKVAVSDLFFNVPARQKFLRSAQIEQGHIVSVIEDISLAFPDIRFELLCDGKRRFLFNAFDIKARVAAILGDEISEKLIDTDEEGDGIRISGFVGKGGRSGGRDMHIFVNKRAIRDKIVAHALAAAFGERLNRGQSPAAILWLHIDPARVDVNVHPTKREVRFANSGAVHDFVMNAVRKALQTSRSSLAARRSSLAASRSSLVASKTNDTMRFSINDQRETSDEKRAARNERRETSNERRVTSDGELRPIGQLGLTYIICEDKDGALVLIDQHAAHERLGFENLMQGYKQGFVPQQILLIPERIELGEKELAYVAEHGEILDRAGFEIEPFGGKTIIVKAVPEILGDTAVKPIFCKLAQELEDVGSSDSTDEEIKRIFAQVACHRQVRAGDRLGTDELAALIKDTECHDITHCPHGRPVTVRIEKTEIEKWFKRR